MKNLLRLLALLLGLATSAHAQQAAKAEQFIAERDSLWQRAARVRARTEARIGQFNSSFGAVGGTRRKIVSYGRLKIKDGLPSSNGFTLVKRQIAKHKTHGAEVEKIMYYGLRNRLLLAEYYQLHQLVRLELNEYPLRDGGEYGTVFRTTQWVRGDYLRSTTHAQENRGKVQRYYYTLPRPLDQATPGR